MRALHQVATLVLIGSLGECAPPHAAAQDSSEAATQSPIAVSRVPWARYADAVTRLYALSFDAPVWLDGRRISRSGHAAIQELLKAGEHGLDPRDYQAATLDSLARRWVRVPLRPIERDQFDAMLSVNLICFLDDLQFGRLHTPPLDRTAGDVGIDLAQAIYDAVSADSIPQLVAATGPQLAQYRNLQRLLVRYRKLAASRTMDRLLPVARIEVRDRYAEAVILRWRLASVGDLEADVIDLGSRYTATDSLGVYRFQVRHGLAATGELDSATVAELNVPFAWRVRQIELALERLRWLPPIGSQRFLVVNVPAFQLFAFDSTGGTGAPTLSMRVIVGSALDTRTPVLFERMQYVEFRPYWYVPLSIARKEILPLVQKDPSYLNRNGMEIVNRSDSVIGHGMEPEILDRIGRGELRVRQRPGALNPLGLVKFVFPNAAAIYLHGTSRAELFARTRRDFSHGCIRVEDPTALAVWTLRDRPRWDRRAIVAAQQGSVTVRAVLTRPMPVVVWYTTAVAAPDGNAWFYADIYGHDRELDEALRMNEVASLSVKRDSHGLQPRLGHAEALYVQP
jgi:L,D-transpeptidase YcbB